MFTAERAALAGARLFPRDLPRALSERLSSLLRRAPVFVPAASYARFCAAMAVYPAALEAVCALTLPLEAAAVAVAALAFVQLSPLLLLYYRGARRRRRVEAELPFVAMLLFISSSGSYSDLASAFAKVEALGPDVLPAFYAESQTLSRNLTYGTGFQLRTVEETFKDHPSAQFREFINGYLATLGSGRDVHEFVREESERLVSLQEERWRVFSSLVGSMTEVAFIFLALLPVGLQMVAGAFLNGSTSSLLAVSVVVLLLLAAVLLFWMDYAQPVLYDRKYPLPGVLATLAAVGAAVCLYLAGALGAVEASALCAAASGAYVALTRGYFARVRSGEREISGMLHDLAEEARAGVALPAALDRLTASADRYPSLRDTIAGFSRLLSLGRPPREAQKRLAHPSWLVRVSFGLLAASVEAGGGFEQLEKLASSFRRVCDAKRSIQTSIMPFAVLGAAVPGISVASFWFLRGMQSYASVLPGFSVQVGTWSVGVSIIATSILTGFVVSKAYSQSFRSLVAVPPMVVCALVAFLIFGVT